MLNIHRNKHGQTVSITSELQQRIYALLTDEYISVAELAETVYGAKPNSAQLGAASYATVNLVKLGLAERIKAKRAAQIGVRKASPLP